MDNELSLEQQEMRDLARRIAEEKIKPVAAEYDAKQEFPWPIVKVFAQTDMFRTFIPTAYDGLGGGILDLAIVTEELSRGCGGIALALAGTALGAYPIILFGSEEQKKRYLPQVAAGEKLCGFALTEPEAGSDAGGQRTTAKKVEGGYVLNGTKQWITNGGEAKIYVVFAVTDRAKGSRGVSAFIVEEGVEGFNYGKKEDKMGIRASSTRELSFSDCFVPKENLLGREGLGFAVAMRTLDRTRPGVAAQAVGIAQAAFELAVNYSRERVQFGKTISSFQAIQFMLADMATEIEAARSLIYKAARYIDAGNKSISKISAMSKLYASDVAMRVTTDAVQVMGGYGYMKDYPAEKLMRDAKITQIYEGTNQIQRLVIATSLIKESAARSGK
ncbi:MAG: acyl-CoA dehydrogenase [Candidatus Coatesbacteria bacterium]|nr:acyl-CoA dehydrogenase [Candidatus Coatesbacteria bacterium]